MSAFWGLFAFAMGMWIENWRTRRVQSVIDQRDADRLQRLRRRIAAESL